MSGSPASPRILIVRVGAMGDVLHGMPAVAALRAALPQAHVAWAVEPRWSPLLVSANGASPLVDQVHMVEAKMWSRHPVSAATLRSIWRLRQQLQAGRYDLVLDLQGTLRSAVIARLSGAARRVGSATPREWPARLFYTEPVTLNARHVVDQAAELATAAAGHPLQAATVPLPTDAAAERWCNALLGGSTGPAVVLAPTAGWGAKQWPAQRFGQLARALHDQGCRVLVNASPHCQDLVAAQVVTASGNTAHPAACTLPQLTALLRAASLVVAGDTGPLHLAAALGVPVVALFGPTDPARNGPYGTRSVVLRHASSQTDHRRHQQTEAGLQSIGVDEVVAAALHLLTQSADSDAGRAY